MRNPGGYSWLGIAPEPKNVPMTEKEKSLLEKEAETMEEAALLLEGKISRYHKLCKKYEIEAGTENGEKIYKELEVLKKEIKQLSKKISRALGESSEITHLDD